MRPTVAPWRRDAIGIALGALLVRAFVVFWAGNRFPPAADGVYYDTIAWRIAHGQGYTWLWPDRVVTYAAHYPIGYPAIVAMLYAIFGHRPWVGAIPNAVCGALLTFAVHRIAAGETSRRTSAVAAALVAIHPSLVGYTPALMTEGMAGGLLGLGAVVTLQIRRANRVSLSGAKTWFDLLLLGSILGTATLVRPQSIIFAPAFGWIASAQTSPNSRARYRVGASAIALLGALVVCSPWTVRNCVRMKSCALVSVNAGWNLLIGTQTDGAGSWRPIVVPAACESVFDEAEKDACFGRAAKKTILEHPLDWLRRAPAKLSATLDYCGAAGWYLHASNPSAFSERAKVRFGAIETVYARFVLATAVAASYLRLRGRAVYERADVWLMRSAKIGLLIGLAFAFSTHAWPSYIMLTLALVAHVRTDSEAGVSSVLLVVLLATIGTHLTFFGAGRYAIQLLPFICLMASRVLDGPLRKDFCQESTFPLPKREPF